MALTVFIAHAISNIFSGIHRASNCFQSCSATSSKISPQLSVSRVKLSADRSMPCHYQRHRVLDRSVGANGEALSDAELEWAVLCLEEAEELMAALDFSTAAGVLERVLGRQAFSVGLCR